MAEPIYADVDGVRRQIGVIGIDHLVIIGIGCQTGIGIYTISATVSRFCRIRHHRNRIRVRFTYHERFCTEPGTTTDTVIHGIETDGDIIPA